MHLRRRTLVQSLVLASSVPLAEMRPALAASEAAEINRDSAAALARLYGVDRRASSLGPKAAGILIFPKIVKAGFIFEGQGGKGALRADSDEVGHRFRSKPATCSD